MDKIIFNTACVADSIAYCCDFGTGDSVPIDQQPCKDFNIDPATGMPMSDITAVLRSQGLDRERLLANLEEFRADYLPDDVSDETALKYMFPRFAQLPSELAEHTEFVTKQRLEEQRKIDEAKELDAFKKSLLDSSKDVNPDDETKKS